MFRCSYSFEHYEMTDDEKALDDELIEAARATDPGVQAFEAKKKAQEAQELQKKTPEWRKVSPIKSNFNELYEEKMKEVEKENMRGYQKKQEGIPYQIMVYLAFVNADGREINVQEIYSFIQRVFVKYHNNDNENWKSCVRHQLSTFRTSLHQELNRVACTYKLKDEKTPLHTKYDQFCEKQLNLDSFGLTDDVTWDMVTKGLVGIPDVIERRPIARANGPRKSSSKRKVTDEEADAVEAMLGFQKKSKSDYDLSWHGM